MLVLMLTLMHALNGAIEVNIFHSSINASDIAEVNADDPCEYTLRENEYPYILFVDYV